MFVRRPTWQNNKILRLLELSGCLFVAAALLSAYGNQARFTVSITIVERCTIRSAPDRDTLASIMEVEVEVEVECESGGPYRIVDDTPRQAPVVPETKPPPASTRHDEEDPRRVIVEF